MAEESTSTGGMHNFITATIRTNWVIGRGIRSWLLNWGRRAERARGIKEPWLETWRADWHGCLLRLYAQDSRRSFGRI